MVTQKPRKPKKKDTQVPQSSVPSDNVADEAVYKELDDSLLRATTTASSLEAEQDSGVNTLRSDEDSLKLKELIKVKRLEMKGGSRTYKLKRLYKIGSKARVASSSEESMGDEDASKQGKKIDDIDADEGITLVDETTKNQGRTEFVEESSKKAEAEIMKGCLKRAREELTHESAKKQKMDDDKETAELKWLVKIIPDEEEVAIDVIPLAVKSPKIVD
nr:hypothetical protein [Tanacetum cinerariifolium]